MIPLSSLSKNAVIGLNEGEISGVIKLNDQYLIVQRMNMRFYFEGEREFESAISNLNAAERNLRKHIELNTDDARLSL